MKSGKTDFRSNFLLVTITFLYVLTCSTVCAQEEQWIILNENNSPLPSYSFSDIEVDIHGNLWVATWEGLYNFDGIEWTIFNSDNSGLPSDLVYNLEIDSENTKWIGTEEGLAKFDENGWAVYDTTNSGLPLYNPVHNLKFDSKGNLWLTTNQPIYYSSILGGSGLTKYDGENWIVFDTLNSDIPNNYITLLETDNEGNVWVGTGLYGNYSVGLVKYDGNRWTIYDKDSTDLPSNIVSSLAVDSDNYVWIGTTSELEARDIPFADAGLAKFDGTSWEVFTVHNSPLTSNNITELLVDEENNLWIGTRPALLRGTEPNTTGGLYFYDGSEWMVFTRDNSPLQSNEITALAMDTHGNLWIAYSGESLSSEAYTSAGIAVYNPDGVVLGVEDDSKISGDYLMLLNYPNPFNPGTTIRFSVTESGETKLVIYNILGQKVETLFNEYKNTGTYEIKWNADDLPTGVYLCRLQSGSSVETRKLVLLK